MAERTYSGLPNITQEDRNKIWEEQQAALADTQATVAKALADERAADEESMGLTERPDETTVDGVIDEVFGFGASMGEESVMHPAFQEMKWQFRLLLARRPTADATGTGYVTHKGFAEMRAAMLKLALTCRDVMNNSEMSRARAEAEREFVKIEAESRKDRTPPSRLPEDQKKRWWAALRNQGLTNFGIERIEDWLRNMQNAGKPGVIEEVKFGYVKIDGEKIEVRDFERK